MKETQSSYLKALTLALLFGKSSATPSPSRNSKFPLYESYTTTPSNSDVASADYDSGAGKYYGGYQCIRLGGIWLPPQETDASNVVSYSTSTNRAFW